MQQLQKAQMLCNKLTIMTMVLNKCTSDMMQYYDSDSSVDGALFNLQVAKATLSVDSMLNTIEEFLNILEEFENEEVTDSDI